MARVSVIVPVYNSGPYLRDFFKSVFSQTYNDFEVIIVNDGSDDDSFSICKEYQYDHRLRLIDQKNMGASAARNAGLDYAVGDYIVFWDSDDRVMPDYLQSMVSIISKDDTDICVCDFFYLDGNNDAILYDTSLTDQKKIGPVAQLFLDSDSWHYNMLWNKIFKSSIIRSNNIRFKDNLKIGEDVVFISNYLSKCSGKYRLIDRKLYTYYDRKASVSATNKTSLFSLRAQYSAVKESLVASEAFLDLNLENLYDRYLHSYIGYCWRVFSDYENCVSERKAKFSELFSESSFLECIKGASPKSSINFVLLFTLKSKRYHLLYCYYKLRIRSRKKIIYGRKKEVL